MKERRRFSQKWRDWLFSGACLLATISVQAGPAPDSFTFRLQGEPETLDWNRAHTTSETYILLNLMEGLLELNPQLKLEPRLAEKYTVSADGLVYTFTLRKGVKWQDGVPLKAGDFVYSWKRLLSPLTAASYAYLLFDVVGAKGFFEGKIRDFSQVGIKALDDLRFEVKLKRPVSSWIYVPTFWVTFPLRKDVVEKYGESWTQPGKMITLGAFTLTARELESKVVLTANPQYWGKRGNLKQVVGQVVRDDQTALTLFETGKLDFMTEVSLHELKRLSQRPELKVFPYLKTTYLGFNVLKYPMNSVRVRRALALALDKAKIVEALQGKQTVATSFLPPGVPGHSKKDGLPLDLLRARSELRLSGLDLSGTTLEFLGPNQDKNKLLAEVIQGQLKSNLGIDVSIELYDNKAFRAQMDLGAYPMFQGMWAADYPDPENFLSVFLSNSGNNRTAWKNAQYDRLVDQARAAPLGAERDKIFDQAEKILLEQDAVIVPLYYEPQLALVSKRSKNAVVNPLNYLYLRNASVE